MKKSLKEMNIFAAQIRKAALRAMNAFQRRMSAARCPCPI